jgi:hypothetical protein
VSFFRRSHGQLGRFESSLEPDLNDARGPVRDRHFIPHHRRDKPLTGETPPGRPLTTIRNPLERHEPTPYDVLDCGHPDNTPDVGCTDNDGRAVCADCCPTCNEATA